jgi:hypothetical protein
MAKISVMAAAKKAASFIVAAKKISESGAKINQNRRSGIGRRQRCDGGGIGGGVSVAAAASLARKICGWAAAA